MSIPILKSANTLTAQVLRSLNRYVASRNVSGDPPHVCIEKVETCILPNL